jgi:hypothetical protein
MASRLARPGHIHDVEEILHAVRDARMRARVLAVESAELRHLSAQLRGALADGNRAVHLGALYRPPRPR